MNIWLDFTNVPHAHFLSVLRRHLFSAHAHRVFCTARDFAELQNLLHKKDIAFAMLGRHHRHALLKLFGSLARYLHMWKKVPAFDVSISCGSYEAALFSKMKGRKTIIFDDNDISPNWLYARCADYFMCPKAFDTNRIIHQGMKRQNIFSYDGYKEDIYLADYTPDPGFLHMVPFREYIVVRPENLSATYIQGHDKKSIVPRLLRTLVEKGSSVLFIPRYNQEKAYAQGLKNVYIPPAVLNGLDVCFYAKAVCTGAGTFAREAACLGVPAVSFFPGEEILSVDKAMIRDGLILHSRDTDDIIEYCATSPRRAFDIKKSKKTQAQVFGMLDAILEKIQSA